MDRCFTLRARWVLPINRPPIEAGSVVISDGSIAEVGRRVETLGATIDLGDVALLPGFVNAHTHLEFSGLERPLGNAGTALPRWIREVIARRHGNRETASDVATGLRESLAHGVTTVGEIATCDSSAYDIAQRPQLALFHEAIGFSAARVDSVAADVQRRLDGQVAANVASGISPHAPYTVHPQLLTRLVNLARMRRVPIAMHLAESPEELQLLAAGTGPFRDLLEERSMWDADAIPKGSTPLDYLQQLADAPRGLAVHGNYFTTREIEFLAARRERLSVVYCPRTHAYFEHPPYPLPAMLAAGALVALGTDSRASNPDLGVLGEVQAAAATFPQIAPEKIVRLATLDGAVALGQEREAGSITPGKSANLCAIVCDADAPYDAIVAAETKTQATWFRGMQVAR